MIYFPFSLICSKYIYIYIYYIYTIYIYTSFLSAIEKLGRTYKNIHNSNIQMSDDFALDIGDGGGCSDEDAVGFMGTNDDETLLGLEDGPSLGGTVTKDGENVGNVVGVLDSCNDGGSDVDAVGAGVYGIVGDDKKVSYKSTLPL